MNNTIILENSVAKFKADNEIADGSGSEAFTLFALQQVTKDYDLSHSEIEHGIVDGGQDGGIDAVLVLVNGQMASSAEELENNAFGPHTQVRVIICQVKYEMSFQESAIDKLHISIPEVLNLELNETALLRRFNPALVERIMLLRKVWLESTATGGKLEISFFYITKANQINVNRAFQSKEDQLVALTEEKTSQKGVKFIKLSAKELNELYQKPPSSTAELKFKENPVPVSFSDDGYGYIGVVSLRDYFSFITTEDDRIKEHIFESNVRHFQGKVDVNEKIRTTLQQDFSRDFWWLNNGISMIASDCRPVPKALFLDDVQIVNGLQTSFVIGNCYDATRGDDSRSVLVKVVVTNDKATIDKIISASNSQTPVSASVLRATDEVQRNIEVFFLNQGFYYDRRKNYYKNLGKPARKVFGIQDTAQAIESILNRNPAMARARPTSIVKNEKSYKRVFDPSVDFRAYLNCCLLHRSVNEFIKSSLPTDARNVARNFSYHTSRVLASILCENPEYDSASIATLDPELIMEGKRVREAHDWLVDALSEYQERNRDENIINIAKSKKYSSMIDDRLFDGR